MKNCKGQLSLFDMKPPAPKAGPPKCMVCDHAKKRGPFYLCRAGGPGYLIRTTLPSCERYSRSEDEDQVPVIS